MSYDMLNQKFFLSGLKFLEHEKKCVWHEDVREFSVIDSESRDVMGIFYLDPFSR
jgi:Zn-dependent oligopeptidase